MNGIEFLYKYREKKLKLAFLILAHTDVKQLNRLISTIDEVDDIYIHVDLKTHDDYLNKIKKKKNVHILEQRFNIFWAGFNMVEATLALIHRMLQANQSYRKVILLSGLDYPLKNSKYVHEYFDNDVNYIRAFNITEYSTDGYQKQIRRYYYTDSSIFTSVNLSYRITRKILQKIKNMRKFNASGLVKMNAKTMPIYEGSQWWALNQDFLRYVDELVCSSSGEVLKKNFRHVFAPDEKFFHTIFFNSKYALQNQAGGPEEFPWEFFQKYRGTFIQDAAPTSFFHNVHVIHPSLNKTFTASDFHRIEYLVREKDNLYIRKIKSSESDELVKMINNLMHIYG